MEARGWYTAEASDGACNDDLALLLKRANDALHRLASLIAGVEKRQEGKDGEVSARDVDVLDLREVFD